METKELKITIPENHEIDWQESAKQEKIIFKKKENTKPRSWKEYLELSTGFDGAGIDWNCGGVQTTGLHHRGKAIVPTHLAQPFIAMMQLMSLRQAWIGDWKPDWTDKYSVKYCICYEFNFDTKEMEVSVKRLHVVNRAFVFPSEKIAKEFYDCFKSLFEQAKPLL